MGTKNNPGKFDCHANAKPDEPMFILLARDKSAPGLVRAWADQREDAILRGDKPSADMEMVREARQCSADMVKYRNSRREG